MTVIPTDSESGIQRKPVVMVIDDSSMSRKMVCHILEPEGFEIIQGIHGAEAVELFQQHRPDVVLLDLVMPVMDGLEACARIKALPGGERTPIFIVTSLATKEAIGKAFAAGAVDYFAKPPNESVMIQRIHRVLEARRWEDALLASEQKLQTITATMGEGLYVLDAQGIIVFVNPEAEHILDWNPSSLLGKKPSETFYPFVDGSTADSVYQASGCGERSLFGMQHDECEYVRYTGERFPVSSVIRNFPDGSGSVVAFSDISVKKKAEEQLRQDLALAARIQREFLPRVISGSPVTVESIFRPAAHVSGDFYDYAWSPDGTRFAGYIADVMGHGIATALQAAALRVVLTIAAEQLSPPDVRLTAANQQVFSCFSAGSFAGALCFEFNFVTQTLCYAAAGINEFLLLSGQQAQLLEIPGHFLGIVKNHTYCLHTMPFLPGDSFFFMTDGISEHLPTERSGGSYVEIKRLLEVAAGQSSDDATAVCIHIAR